MKTEYLDAIKNAGFQDVKIVSEATFPIDFITNDPIVEETIKKLGITLEQVKEYVGIVSSIKVEGHK